MVTAYVKLTMADPTIAAWRLDRTALGSPDGPIVSAATAAVQARDILAPATSVTVHRGMTKQGLLYSTDIGTATITITDPPPWPDLRPGLPLTVDAYTGRIFTGVVRNARRTWDKLTNREHLTIAAVDAVNKAANTTLYPGQIRLPLNLTDGTETPDGLYAHDGLRSRFQAICTAAGLSWQKDSAVGPFHDERIYCDMTSRTAQEWLTITCNSVACLWWCDAYGKIIIHEDAPQTATVTLSDVASPSYTAIDQVNDSDDVINIVTINEHRTDLQRLDGATQATATDLTNSWTRTDQTSIASYGPHSTDVDVLMGWSLVVQSADEDDYDYQMFGSYFKVVDDPRGDWLMTLTTPLAGSPSSVTVRNNPTVADVCNPVNIVRRGTTWPCRVIARDDTITPAPDRPGHQVWDTTYTLAPRRTS